LSVRQDPVYRCRSCGQELETCGVPCPRGDGIVEALYARKRFRRFATLRSQAPGIWRYRRVLPPVENAISLDEGWTPLHESRAINQRIGCSLFFKDEGRNPSGSFKDRAAALMVSVAVAQGRSTVVLTSSGNAAGSVAMYAAAAGIECVVFMSEGAPREKVVHTRSFGARVVQPRSTSGRLLRAAARQAADEHGWAVLSTTAQENPLAVEGFKTIAYEIAEQGLPDVVATPVGAGTLLLGLRKGFAELLQWGLIERMPRLLGVQPEGCNPVVRAFRRNARTVEPVTSVETIATGVMLEDPGLDGAETLRAVRETRGAMLDVPDEEIIDAMRLLARQEGIFAEPSGALSVAGVIVARERGILDSGDRVVALITGSGFKDIANVEKSLLVSS